MELAVIPARTDEHIDKVQHIGNSRRIAAAGGGDRFLVRCAGRQRRYRHKWQQ